MDQRLHLEQPLAFEHDREDEAGCCIARIVKFNQLPQQCFSVFFLDRVNRGRRGRLVLSLPAGDESFPVARLAELIRPAFVTDVDAQEVTLLVKENRVVRLLVSKGRMA